jgi:hypothetical protein
MIKAIETTYKGVLFRSRLEARWAMLFDAFHLDWRYEHEAFGFGDVRYLPDFWLPELQTWVEIKPPFDREYSEEEQRWVEATGRCRRLATETKKRVVMFALDFGAWLPKCDENESTMCFFPGGDDDHGYFPCLCIECGRLGIEWQGRGNRICKHPGLEDGGMSSTHPRINRAVDIILAHRFWSGRAA